MQVEVLLGFELLQPRAFARRLHRDVDDRMGEEEHLDVVGIAPDLHGTAAHFVAIGLHALDATAALGDDRVGPARGEALAARRAAGLADRHAALRRARRIQGTAALEVFALVVDRMNLAAVGEHRDFAVQHHGVGLPRLPQPGHHLGEFVGDIVTLIVRIVLVAPVILRGAVVAAGHAVPADAALRHVVERIDQPRQQVRRIFRHRQRRHDRQVLRRLREIGHQHGRIELRRAGGIFQVAVVRALVGIGHVRRILDDEIVEARAIHAFRQVDEQVGHHPARDVRARPVRAPGLRSIAL